MDDHPKDALQVLTAAREVTGHDIPAEKKGRRPGDPDRRVVDSSLIQSELAWRPRYPGIRPILESAWAWHRDPPRGYSV